MHVDRLLTQHPAAAQQLVIYKHSKMWEQGKTNIAVLSHNTSPARKNSLI